MSHEDPFDYRHLPLGTPLTHAGIYDLYPTHGFAVPSCDGRVSQVWERVDRSGPGRDRHLMLYLPRDVQVMGGLR